MRRVCRTPKTTDTLSESVIIINFTLQHWVGEGASILRLHVHFLSRYFIQMIQQMVRI